MRRITTNSTDGRDPDEKRKSRESVIANVIIFGAICAVIRVCKSKNYPINDIYLTDIHFPIFSTICYSKSFLM